MKTIKQHISSFLVKFFTPEATVQEITFVDNCYFDIVIKLPKKVLWTPGDKVQFLLPTNELRSYTPYFFYDDKKTFRTLIYNNKLGEGAYFLNTLKFGDRFKVLGPRKSLDSSVMPQRTIFFADESSLGLAYCLRHKIHKFVFECHSSNSFKMLIENKFNLENFVIIEREKNYGHLEQLTKELISENAEEIYLTGQRESSQLIGQSLINHGLAKEKIKFKLYWALTTRRSSKKNAANS